MYVQLRTDYVECDRWRGVAGPHEIQREELVLVDPRVALRWVTRLSQSGLTVGGYGLPADHVQAVHWTAASQRGEWVFLRGHGALGKGEPVYQLREDPGWTILKLRGLLGAPNFEDGLHLRSRRELCEALNEEKIFGNADCEIAYRRQWGVAAEAVAARGFAHFANSESYTRFMTGLCRACDAHLYEVREDQFALVVGHFQQGRGTLYVHANTNGVYLGTAEFWRSEEMAAVREEFPERLRTRWFGSE